MTAAVAAIDSAIAELKALLGDRLSTVGAVREHHGKDESWHVPHAPDAVAFPHSTEEVAAIVKICARHGSPVIPFGTGTSLEGHVIPARGGVCVDLTQMNQVLRVSAADLDKTVKDGLGLRWSFMGPVETIELNAPQGIADYCARYTGFYKRLQAEPAPPSVYEPRNTKRVIESWGKPLAPARHAAKTRWRDGRLAALAAHKRRQKPFA